MVTKTKHHGRTVVWCQNCDTELVTLAYAWPQHTDLRPVCVACWIKLNVWPCNQCDCLEYCGTEIEFVSQRPDEGWEKQWRHLPSGVEVVGPRRCPFYAEPVEGIDGYCTCYPDQRGMTADCGVRQHRRAANHWKERDQ